MLHNQYFDILMLQETKLGDFFPNAQFNIHGYVIHRIDHKSNSGGIIAVANPGGAGACPPPLRNA